MKKIPFNLKDALAGKPVVTRDNRTVSELHFFSKADGFDNGFKIAAVVDGKLETFTDAGRYLKGNNNSALDLFMLVEEKEVWFNLYYNVLYNNYYVGNTYETEIDAKKNATPNCIKTFSTTVDK